MPTVKEVIERQLKGVKGHVAVAIWQEDDVIGKAREKGIQLSHKVAGEIIESIDDNQDCEMGITWDTLDYYIDEWKDKHPHYRRCPKCEDED